jgi:hypothetical protein
MAYGFFDLYSENPKYPNKSGANRDQLAEAARCDQADL